MIHFLVLFFVVMFFVYGFVSGVMYVFRFRWGPRYAEEYISHLIADNARLRLKCQLYEGRHPFRSDLEGP